MESVYAITYNFKSLLGHYIKIDDAFGGEERKINNKDSKTNVFTKEESTDTITYNLKGKGFKQDTNQEINSFDSTIKGYRQAQKDSAYHVNRSNSYVRIEVKLTKKYH